MLNEFYVVVTRKLARPMSEGDAAAAVGEMALLPVVAIDRHLALDAVAFSRRYQLSLWDALIVRAAQVSGCAEIITEDMQDGVRFDSVVVRDPFRSP